jgi:carbon storage regulator
MLVLSRRPNQTIHIVNSITVKVIRASKNQVRLGVEAPPEVPIHRSELRDAIMADGDYAADGSWGRAEVAVRTSKGR